MYLILIQVSKDSFWLDLAFTGNEPISPTFVYTKNWSKVINKGKNVEIVNLARSVSPKLFTFEKLKSKPPQNPEPVSPPKLEKVKTLMQTNIFINESTVESQQDHTPVVSNPVHEVSQLLLSNQAPTNSLYESSKQNNENILQYKIEAEEIEQIPTLVDSKSRYESEAHKYTQLTANPISDDIGLQKQHSQNKLTLVSDVDSIFESGAALTSREKFKSKTPKEFSKSPKRLYDTQKYPEIIEIYSNPVSKPKVLIFCIISFLEESI